MYSPKFIKKVKIGPSAAMKMVRCICSKLALHIVTVWMYTVLQLL